MKISVIGVGNVGITLGKKWAQAGHQVCFGVRSREDHKYNELSQNYHVRAISEALPAGEVILLALPGIAMADFAYAHGSELNGKIIIDATNKIQSPVLNSLDALKNHSDDIHLIRAFSSLGWENFENPSIGGHTIDLFYCCDPSAREVAEQLISDTGLHPIHLGDLSAAELVDNLTRVWLTLAFNQGHRRRMAIKLLEE